MPGVGQLHSAAGDHCILANLSEVDEWKWLISFAVPCLDGEKKGETHLAENYGEFPPGDPIEPLLQYSSASDFGDYVALKE